MTGSGSTLWSGAEAADVDSRASGLGPTSLIWELYGDIRVQFFGFQRLAATENAIAPLAQAVSEHSRLFGDFFGRALRTAKPVLHSVYSAEPNAWGRKVRDFHRDIKGTMPDGGRYHALDPELFAWAHATFVDQIIYTADTFVRRLTDAEKAQIYEEGKDWYAGYGVSARAIPANYEEFVQYWDRMVEQFVKTPTLSYGTGYLRKGIPVPPHVPKPVWKILSKPTDAAVQSILIGTLPAQAREAAGLEWTDKDEARYQAIARRVRQADPIISRLPVTLRYLPWAAEGWRRTATRPTPPPWTPRREPDVLPRHQSES